MARALVQCGPIAAVLAALLFPSPAGAASPTSSQGSIGVENDGAMETCVLAYIVAATLDDSNVGDTVPRITRQAIHDAKPSIPLGPTTPGTAWLAAATGFGDGAPEHFTCVSPDGYQFTINGTGYRLGAAVGGMWIGPHGTHGRWIDHNPGADSPTMTTTPSTSSHGSVSLSRSRANHAVLNYLVKVANGYNADPKSVGKMTDVSVGCNNRVSSAQWSCATTTAISGVPGCAKMHQTFDATLLSTGSIEVAAIATSRRCTANS